MASAKDSIIVITFVTGKTDPLLFEKWVEGLEMLVSAREWKSTGLGGFIHVVRQSVVVVGGQDKEKGLSLLRCFGFVCDVISKGIYLCQPCDKLGPHNFVNRVQAWRSRSRHRAVCYRL